MEIVTIEWRTHSCVRHDMPPAAEYLSTYSNLSAIIGSIRVARRAGT